MTVKTQIEEIVAGAHTLAGQLKTCALHTDVPAVKDMYNEMAGQIEDMIPKLEGRRAHVQKEEPQYR
ncbi:MAG: hypothetical protein QM451_05455 [Bacillota bacterium]|jgi:hypothetical protein|nr:hypothetical protein [Bacillota bacterium]HHT90801.1 DUF1657 domain-containing protein [Bacillota bacterium]